MPEVHRPIDDLRDIRRQVSALLVGLDLTIEQHVKAISKAQDLSDMDALAIYDGRPYRVEVWMHDVDGTISMRLKPIAAGAAAPQPPNPEAQPDVDGDRYRWGHT
ncbi:hypothetical protein [Pseudonocardia sp. N23]|uniref:hypothetical protein n=1 Tax=Pseudonocardia sp. N23 TaxID=1987376 RepID=UPI000BFDD88F|nr:hypothetical protein [Pseudonocardia sp. N23]GAY12050.1 hypothetical protein TOK_0440 [Pseudonocardia sp. N23]